MENIYTLEDLLLKLDEGDYFHLFLKTKQLEAGLFKLNPGEMDTQEPHLTDEIYYVIKGNGYINIDGKNRRIREGTCVFIPAKLKHSFHGNLTELIVLFVFGS